MANMAAGSAAASDPPAPAEPGSALQYSLLLEHLIGEKRPVQKVNPAVMGGLPMPPKSAEQQRMERVMESCGFKAALACVGGQCPSGL